MIPNVINTSCQLRFTVLDVNNNGVTGLIPSSFSVRLYDPSDNEVSGSYTIVRKELGNGDYEVTFTPDVLGRWYIIVTHSTYFPWGKAQSILVADAANDISTTDIFTTNIDGYNFEDIIKIVLAMLGGLTAGVGTNTEVFKNPQGTKNRVTFGFDANNNRITVGFDLS